MPQAKTCANVSCDAGTAPKEDPGVAFIIVGSAGGRGGRYLIIDSVPYINPDWPTYIPWANNIDPQQELVDAQYFGGLECGDNPPRLVGGDCGYGGLGSLGGGLALGELGGRRQLFGGSLPSLPLYSAPLRADIELGSPNKDMEIQIASGEQTTCCETSCAAWRAGGGNCSAGMQYVTQLANQRPAGRNPSYADWVTGVYDHDDQFVPDLQEYGMFKQHDLTTSRTTCCEPPMCSQSVSFMEAVQTSGPSPWNHIQPGHHCKPCPAGFDGYGTGTGWLNYTKCTACAPGQYLEHFTAGVGHGHDSRCHPCPAGKYDRDINIYHDEYPSTACADCEPGMFSSSTGVTTCARVCPAGTYSAAGATGVGDCVECAIGKYDHDSSATTDCRLCPANHFNNISGSSKCQVCAAGLSSIGGLADCVLPTAAYFEANYPEEWARCATKSSFCAEGAALMLASPSQYPLGYECGLFCPTELQVLWRAYFDAKESTRYNTSNRSAVLGCTDPSATNFDQAKAANDGSCVYDCDTLANVTNRIDAAQCLIYSRERRIWETDPPKSEAVFWEQSTARLTIVQGLWSRNADYNAAHGDIYGGNCSRSPAMIATDACSVGIELVDSGDVVHTALGDSQACIWHMRCSDTSSLHS
eukprot:COSAG02_NODE_5045_length_4699_cov_7.833696_2_plen_641_part_00